ncbi:chondroitin AC/alginate lyase, partial [Basidiobolus meristosporus CBS 931.73]
YSVTLKKQTPPSNRTHDYMSLAKYFWPDPNSPTGLPYIRRDGHVNPEIKEIKDFEYLRAMFMDVYTLSLAYRFYRNESYSQKAVTRITEWFIDPVTKMNPHIKYGSMIKGEESGRQTGVLDFFHVYRFVDAVEVLRESPYWSESVEGSFKEWLTAYYKWLQEDPLAKAERAALNNHGTFYDCQLISVAILLKDFPTARQVAESAKSRRIEAQISKDGSQPYETLRQTSFSYSVFNLRGLFLLASLSERVGVDLWNYHGSDERGIKKAVDYILPYALNNGAGWPY